MNKYLCALITDLHNEIYSLKMFINILTFLLESLQYTYRQGKEGTWNKSPCPELNSDLLFYILLKLYLDG